MIMMVRHLLQLSRVSSFYLLIYHNQRVQKYFHFDAEKQLMLYQKQILFKISESCPSEYWKMVHFS